MKNLINIIGLYIKRNMVAIVAILISFGIFLSVFSLYSLPFEAVGYAALLTGIFVLLIGAMDFWVFYKKHIFLNEIKRCITISDFTFPSSKDQIEKDYQELIRIINEDRKNIINEKDRAFTEMVEYYTTWAHQIKTPISAMGLLLQSQKSDTNTELLNQLFRIEEYVHMVLQFLRTESMSSDLVFERHSLDDIVKQAIRKYAKLFIYKKIKLNYKELNCYVLTDEKWLTFVIEQVLSNALKYTNAGEISIYMDNNLADTLVIEDTGIGIEEEDLPRIFEKGFTGYNGRADKKSTGIGMYLCKKILDKLSHTITVESMVGKGTKVKIGLDVNHIEAE
ncbi:MAG TPA: HAMP domain-containing histidine kinase [Clostridiaceae bacterium]|nr:HAMP domain-containing histidine kinase [Clostridiaceae bacterium]